MKHNVANLIDMLHEYQDGELNESGKMYLKDELVDLNGQLHKEEIEEGWRYETVMIHVKQCEELPQPFSEMTIKSPLTDEEYTLQIKEIVRLRWNMEGDLLVEALVKRKKS